MEPVCCGWLIKSPPEQKSSGAWKLFAAKWKRRYFVLYAPPTSSAIIGKKGAMLEYYSSKKMNTKVGAINLEDCDEVLSNLDSDIYKNVFGLHTKHKGRYRTYYLVADSEEEMNGWVSNLCSVLGLLENDEFIFHFSPENRLKSTSCILPKPVPNFTTHPNFVHPQNINTLGRSRTSSSGISSLSSRLNSSETDLLDSKLFSPFAEEEKKIRAGSSVPELESIHISPVTPKKRENMELPPIPPEKSKKSLEDLIGDGEGSKVGLRQVYVTISNLMAEECLGAPPPKPPKERKKTKPPADEYNIPKPLETHLSSYDMPKCSNEFSADIPGFGFLQSDAAYGSSHCNAPKASPDKLTSNSPPVINLRNPPIPARRKSVASKKTDSSRSLDVGVGDSLYSTPKSTTFSEQAEPNDGNFYNVPPNHFILQKESGSSFDESEMNLSYDVPNSSSLEILPVVGRKAEKLQKANSASPSVCEDRDEGQMYDAPKALLKPVPAKRTQLPSQGASNPTFRCKPEPATKPKIPKEVIFKKISNTLSKEDELKLSLQKAGAQRGSNSFPRNLVMTADSIRFTQRSKSFKRSLDGAEFSNEKQMPTKRTNEINTISSDDCDSEDEC